MSQPGPPPGARAGPARPRRRADVVVTVALLVPMSLGAVGAAFVGQFVGLSSDGCVDYRACADRVGLATPITAGAVTGSAVPT